MLLIDGRAVQPDLVKVPQGADVRLFGGADLALSAFELRVPVASIVNEFDVFAREQTGEGLTPSDAAVWLRNHLQEAPEDVYVVLAIVQQASKPTRQPSGIRGIFGTKRPANEAMWQLAGVEGVDVDKDELVISGRCHPVQR